MNMSNLKILYFINQVNKPYSLPGSFHEHEMLLFNFVQSHIENTKKESEILQLKKRRFKQILDEMSEYDFVVMYRLGEDNDAADYLSRLPQILGDLDETEELTLPKELKGSETVDGGWLFYIHCTIEGKL